MDRGALGQVGGVVGEWATAHSVTDSQAQLKRLSTHAEPQKRKPQCIHQFQTLAYIFSSNVVLAKSHKTEPRAKGRVGGYSKEAYVEYKSSGKVTSKG